MSFTTANCIFNIREEMEKPEKFSKLLVLNFIFIVILTIVFSVGSIWHHGHDLNQIILFNQDYGNWTDKFIKYGFQFAILTGYPILLSPVLIILEADLFG